MVVENICIICINISLCVFFEIHIYSIYISSHVWVCLIYYPFGVVSRSASGCVSSTFPTFWDVSGYVSGMCFAVSLHLAVLKELAPRPVTLSGGLQSTILTHVWHIAETTVDASRYIISLISAQGKNPFDSFPYSLQVVVQENGRVLHFSEHSFSSPHPKVPECKHCRAPQQDCPLKNVPRNFP